MRRPRLENPLGVLAVGLGTVALVVLIVLLFGAAPSPALVTAGSIAALLGSTAGAGLLIMRSVDRDRVRELLSPSTCPRCGRGIHPAYIAGRQVWAHNIGGRERCWKRRYEDHEPLPVPISPGRPR